MLVPGLPGALGLLVDVPPIWVCWKYGPETEFTSQQCAYDVDVSTATPPRSNGVDAVTIHRDD